MSFNSSSGINNSDYSHYYPWAVPSAPPIEAEELTYPTLYPKITPIKQTFPNYPTYLLSQPSTHPTYSSYQAPIHQPAPSLNHRDQEVANKAYLHLYPHLQEIHDLPSINLGLRSIFSLKKIEERSKEGITYGLLSLAIKVLQVVGKLALGLAVGSTIAIGASALLGVSAAVAFTSLLVVSPIIGGLVLGGFACRIASRALQQLQESLAAYSFRASIEKDKALLQPLNHLKIWMQIDQLSTLEKEMRDTVRKIQTAQKTAGYHPQRNQQEFYLDCLIKKFEQFHEIEDKLKIQTSMPLLNRFLSN